MTPNRRIFLNVIATYGRSLYALIIGLLCGRWAYVSLGTIDYGLLGLVGGLIAFVTFFNQLLATAVARFYAVNVGAAQRNGAEGVEQCKKWFNTALSIHWSVPSLLLLIGYPTGAWAVRNFFEIPADRIADCVWVWRFSCLSCYVAMMNVPFAAMYNAKQEIAELTIYSFATTTLNAIFLYWMVMHRGVWLVKYSLWTCLLAVVPNLLIGIRAVVKYKECRFDVRYLWSLERYKELAVFAFARFWWAFSPFVSSQGQAILINKFLGPTYNASKSVGLTVSSHANNLSSALSSAFSPAIMNMAGAGNDKEVRRLAFVVCRLGAAMVLVFAVPLMLEIDTVLTAWLTSPPPFATELCLVILLRSVFDRMTEGYGMAIMGFGRGVMRYSWVIGWTGIATVAIAWILFLCGLGMWSICIALLSTKAAGVLIRLKMGETLAELPSKRWLGDVLCPLLLVSLVASVVSFPIRFLLSASLYRVGLTTIMCEVAMLPMLWFFVFGVSEREYIFSRINKYLPGLGRKVGRK